MPGGPSSHHTFGRDSQPHVNFLFYCYCSDDYYGFVGFLKGGPHPGMRMAGQAGGQGQGGGGGSSGKGLWHSMLPFYTVGVIVFLLYTLSKVLSNTVHYSFSTV